MRGHYHQREGKVTAVFRKRMCINVERVTRDKVNGQPHNCPIKANKVIITKLKMDKDRKNLLERKKKQA